MNNNNLKEEVSKRIKKLYQKNENLEIDKNSIDGKEELSKILYLFGIPAIFLSYTGLTMITSDYIAITEVLPVAAIVSSFIIPFNLIINGTFIARKKKISKITKEISINNENIIFLSKQMELLKQKVNNKEKKPINIQRINPIDKTYEKKEEKAFTKKLRKI